MKNANGWWWPDSESHIIHWMNNTKKHIMNGRQSYQGLKQQEAYKACSEQKTQLRTAIDVGAHVGLWSYNMAQLFWKVEAFEPVMEHRECFRMNVHAPNVSLHPYALGAQQAFNVAFTMDRHNTGSTFLNPDAFGDVEMRTLDSYMLRDVDFIKIDCEGYELHVLEGAADTIDMWKPVMCVEQKRDMASSRYGLPMQGAVEHLVNRHGYRVLAAFGGDYIMSV